MLINSLVRLLVVLFLVCVPHLISTTRIIVHFRKDIIIEYLTYFYKVKKKKVTYLSHSHRDQK